MAENALETMDIDELDVLIDSATKRREELRAKSRARAASASHAKHGPCDCGSYEAQGGPNSPFKFEPPYWVELPNGDLTCSHCGSWHPEQALAFFKTADGVENQVNGTTKGYKVYVRRPGISNAGDGAIKFYNWHHPKNRDLEFQEAVLAALKVTFDARKAGAPQ